jgi:hypothetical protein
MGAMAAKRLSSAPLNSARTGKRHFSPLRSGASGWEPDILREASSAFMSSLDGVGRYFPLTLFALAPMTMRAAIPPPELDSQDDWFDAAEGSPVVNS